MKLIHTNDAIVMAVAGEKDIESLKLDQVCGS
jgi:hypothetical protein